MTNRRKTRFLTHSLLAPARRRSDCEVDMSTITLNGSAQEVRVGERLIDAINSVGIQLPQVCYHPQLGPIQTCDTCMVEVDGKLVRACGTQASAGMSASTKSSSAQAAQ